MPERHDLEALLLAHLAVLDRLVAGAARRQGLRGDDVAEFAASVRLRLVEDDYAVLRKFRGESSLTTYLAVVVTMLAREYRVQRWGRWRPSAEARRRGPLAVRLETLVHRDGYALHEAGELLRTQGETDLPDRALATLLAALPMRTPRPTGAAEVGAAEAVAGDGSAEDAVLRDEAAAERQREDALLARALARLPAEDQVIVRLRYWQGLSIADVARALGLEQRPLYRRLERTLAALRRDLEAAGVSAAQIQALLDESLPAEPLRAEGASAPDAPGADARRIARRVHPTS